MDKIKAFLADHKKAILVTVGVIVVGVVVLKLRGSAGGSSDDSAGGVASVGGFGGITLGTPIGTGNTIPSADNGDTQYPGGTNTGDLSGSGTGSEAPPEGSTDLPMLDNPFDGKNPYTSPGNGTPIIQQPVTDVEDEPIYTPPDKVLSSDASTMTDLDSGKTVKVTDNLKNLLSSALPNYKKRQVVNSGYFDL